MVRLYEASIFSFTRKMLFQRLSVKYYSLKENDVALDKTPEMVSIVIRHVSIFISKRHEDLINLHVQSLFCR